MKQACSVVSTVQSIYKRPRQALIFMKPVIHTAFQDGEEMRIWVVVVEVVGKGRRGWGCQCNGSLYCFLIAAFTDRALKGQPQSA